jgi:AcrR family transcriptional regulator
MNKSIKPDISNSADGRLRRSQRSRQLIITAMHELINEGNFIPTAQQVADRADITIRTVFRHFSEMEQLYAELDASIRESYEQLFIGCDRSGSLTERVLHAVEVHADAYIELSSLNRATISLIWRSEVIEKTYNRNIRKLRKDLDDWLPELEDVPRETREAVDAIASFEFWNRLYTRQGVSKNACINIINQLILGCLDPSGPRS